MPMLVSSDAAEMPRSKGTSTLPGHAMPQRLIGNSMLHLPKMLCSIPVTSRYIMLDLCINSEKACSHAAPQNLAIGSVECPTSGDCHQPGRRKDTL